MSHAAFPLRYATALGMGTITSPTVAIFLS